MCGFCGQHIACVVIGRGVGVVNNQRLFGFQAGLEQNLLAVPRFEHIQIDADMRVHKILLKKCGFTRRLHANKNNQLHLFKHLAHRQLAPR